MRSSDNESSGGINVELGLIVYKLSGKHGIKYIFLNVLVYLLLSNVLIMLCG